MLRGRRVFTSGVLAYRPATTVATPMLATSPALMGGAQQRYVADKIIIGAASSFMSCSTTLLLCHLLIVPVTATVAAATTATAAASGALCIIDGGEGPGTTFGGIMGMVVGAMGGYYAKSQNEPWRR